MERIKIGQIGICHEHAAAKMDALRKLPDVFEIVGVVDDRRTDAARFSGDDLRSYAGLPWMSEAELFAVQGLQAVTVETPNTDLVPAARRCVARGLPIHMDKPGGEDPEAFRRLLAECDRAQVPLQMGYMFRNNPAMQFCRDAVQKGWLGEVVEIHGDMSHDYGGEAYQEYLAKFKGGILFNLGCHLMDLVVSIMGCPESVHPFMTSVKGTPSDSMNNGLAVLSYPHAQVTVRACSRVAGGLDHRRFLLSGTKGAVTFSPLERFDGQPLEAELTLHEGNAHYAAGVHRLRFPPREDRYVEQLLEFAQIVRGKMKNPYSTEHDGWVQDVVLAASGYTTWKK
ncbi:Gfo/Idh/MocA family oxidoreductase [Kiritimatiellaeota bacterium B1221]|nr:Gfo/Idh/MocA family oxidoreductase [Kiritimatiellaeota bacterium B1221]